jgi:pyrroline-5-carboxylate reductase
MKIGIVGYGTMGAAIARGLAAAKGRFELAAYDKSEERRREAARHGVSLAPSLEALIQGAEVLLVAVKPQDLAELLAAVGKKGAGARIVSIVAGRSIATFEAACGTREVARLMPNIAATVGESYVGVSCHPQASRELREAALCIGRSIGVAVEVPERLLSAVTGIAGSGIAYVFAFLHAMAMGGVHAGLDYRSALAAAVQTTRGAVALLSPREGAQEAASPVDLLTRVTSPAGTTIEGVRELEAGAFTATVMRAVKAAADRAEELERQAGQLRPAPERS